ncbi:hypothetical protein [Metabacillus malikii]|uniref:Uncharacterized protein n=1 Tax=Metabacillus malikii TaxID=1504265 RepID=A0ABT9ZHL5_9BACI|nr:hypothetical protein [Metabacillus malikii]MDQ0231774.1 hypothetical protein [Metabacillus malikii]
MKPKYEKALFPRFRDDLNKRSKNVVFKYTEMIIEEKYPELYEEVKYLIDRNVEKEALLKKVGHLPGINTTSEEFQKELFELITRHFETYYDDKGEQLM